MDAVDKAILNRLQYDFPLTTTPFSTIACRLGLSPREVIGRIVRLKHKNIIRQIGAIFDSSKIGYHSVLAAFKVPRERINEVAQRLNANPAVTHNYARNGRYTLWFTVTVPRNRELSKEVAEMASCARVSDWLFLPTIKNFKVSFQLDMGMGDQKRTQSTRASDKPPPKRPPLPLAINKFFVRELQKDLRVTIRPYRPAAQRLGLTEGQITAEMQRYLQAGAIRRIAAVLKPVQAGYPANILTVWKTPPEKTAILGQAAARRKQVSHCYERPQRPGWPYSVYMMIHGRSTADCRKVIHAIAADSGITHYRELPTVKEYKKDRVDYFPHIHPCPQSKGSCG